MKKRYVDNGYTFILSNNYDKISKVIHECMRGMRVPCKYCGKLFLTKETRKHIIKLSTELESLFIYIHVCHALHVSYFGTCIRIWVTGT